MNKIEFTKGPVGVVGDMTAAVDRVYRQFAPMLWELEKLMGDPSYRTDDGYIPMSEMRCRFIRRLIGEKDDVLKVDDATDNPFRAARVTHTPSQKA